MEIINKIAQRQKDPNKGELPKIAFFGDSVTQGCFEIYMKGNSIETIYDPSSAYHKYFSDILSELFPSVPVSIINAGISGDSTKGALLRIQRDVLSQKPDLTVVCFGLNDCVSRGITYAQQYADNLKNMFTQLIENGSEVIFMTPNMMCTEVSCHIKDEKLISTAKDVAKAQNDGVLTEFLERAKKAAEECGVRVCDVYSKWMRINECGVDTTELLSNSINHPTRQMNKLFAYSLIETIFN